MIFYFFIVQNVLHIDDDAWVKELVSVKKIKIHKKKEKKGEEVKYDVFHSLLNISLIR